MLEDCPSEDERKAYGRILGDADPGVPWGLSR